MASDSHVILDWRHQRLTTLCVVVEHYRNLWNFVRVVHEKEENGDSVCNPRSCPKMSAGR